MRDAILALTRAQLRVLAFLSDEPSGNTQIQISARQLAEKLQLSLRTIKSALRRLNAEGFLVSCSGSRREAAQVLVRCQLVPQAGKEASHV